VLGKPSPAMFEMALRVLGTSPARTLMIGDRLETDIAGAKAAGLKAALVLTGVTKRAAEAADGPDASFYGLPELLAAWTRP
jgi:4-nitrophenyl phosphatase